MKSIINLLFSLFIFLPSFVFSSEGKYCDSVPLWHLSVCADTEELLSRKSNILGSLLEESVIRKTVIPEAVREAGKAVFNIGVQHYDPELKYKGGSGFFLFDVNTFFTNHHVLYSLFNEEGVLDWSEVVFKDQRGNKRNFRVTGVKLVSVFHDVAVLSVEGYEGPVLDLAMSSPKAPPPYVMGQAHSYIIGYPRNNDDESKFKIQSVHSAFDITDIRYGVFPELVDSFFRITNFGGSSGGPMVSREGKVEAIFSSMIRSELTTPFLVARKINSLIEKIKNSKKISHSVQEAKEMMMADREALVELAQSGNANAQFELIFEYPGDLVISRDLVTMLEQLDHVLKQHIWVAAKLDNNIEEKINKDNKDLLHTTWYEMGASVYYNKYYDKNDLKIACDFWNRAGQLGHPYIRLNFVVIPYKKDIIYCGN